MQGCMIGIQHFNIYKHDGPMARLLLWVVYVSSNELNGVAFVKKHDNFSLKHVAFII